MLAQRWVSLLKVSRREHLTTDQKVGSSNLSGRTFAGNRTSGFGFAGSRIGYVLQ